MESAGKRRRIDAVHVPRYTLPEDLFPSIVAHWDVATLVEKKRVCRDWKQLCNDAIDAKRTETIQKAFSTNHELVVAVRKYCGFNEDTYEYSQVCSPEDAEEIATTYGWPINSWDVSNVQDFSNLFCENDGFNEDIGSWNVSNATSMNSMFLGAKSFNQDISSWDVSIVTDFNWMFTRTRSFNQDLYWWDTSNVTTMYRMFNNSTSFNQDISEWIVSNVTDTTEMFQRATLFNQNLSQWDTSRVVRIQRKFDSATSFQQDVASWGNSWDVTRF
jgi:surface protein